MYFPSVSVAAFLVAATSPYSTEAFSSLNGPPTKSSTGFLQHHISTSPQARRLSPLYFADAKGGMEELQEMTEETSVGVLEKQVRKSPSFWKMAGIATIPVSAVLGFGLVPSRRLAAHAAGALVTGVAGAIGKSKLDTITETGATPAIAQAILDFGLDDPSTTSGSIQEIQSTFGIDDDEEFECLCSDVYSKYLLGMVKFNAMAKTSELTELENLKTALSLSNLQVGEAHAAAAHQWFLMTSKQTSEDELDDPDHPDRKAMDKFLFLTERALRQGGETLEAFNFEMTRVAKEMKLTLPVALERVAEVQEPFYQRGLKSTRSKLGSSQVSEDTLKKARRTLGISDQTAYDMHIACLNEEVKELLGMQDSDEEDVDTSEAKFVDGAMDRLDELREVLGLSDQDAEYEIVAETTPLYQETALASMKAVLDGTSTPDKAWDQIEARRQELLLPESESRDLISSMVMQALGGPLEKTNTFSKVNNDAATYDNLLETLQAKKALISLLSKSGWDDFENFDKTFCDPWEKQSANGFLRSDERIKMYKTFMTRSLRKSEDDKISDEMYSTMMEVKGLLGISEDQAEVESRTAFGPEVQQACLKAMTEIVKDYTPSLAENMKKNIDKAMESYKMSDEFLQEQGAAYYTKAVSLISEKSPGGIPTAKDIKALEVLRDMFNLDIKDTYSSHMASFGSVYKKSIKEAMGSTGVIKPEFREGLTELRERLGVQEEDTKELFLEAIEEKFVPMVEWINSEMERTQLNQKQLAERRGRDMGQDMFQSGKTADGVLGLGAEVNIMGDIINLVDFYTENKIAEEKEVGTKEMEGEEVPVLETSYPITAIGTGALQLEMAEYLYRQFVVGAFQAQGETASRYEEARGAFGGILGLTSEKMKDINDNIGSTVYDNFVSRSMATKGTLDQQDMMFLAQIQGKLGLSSEQSEQLLMQSQKKVLSEEINTVMDNPSPASIKAFREKCNSMGVDLSDDVGVSGQRLNRLFEAEVVPLLKDGTITVETTDVLNEIQESLNLDEDECGSMFEDIVLRLGGQALGLVQSELMRGRDENVTEPIEELLRYAMFVEGELDLTVEESMANQIFNIVDAMAFEGVDKEDIDHNKQMLKVALGIGGN